MDKTKIGKFLAAGWRHYSIFSEENINGERYAVIKIPAYKSFREVISFIKKVWPIYAAQRIPGGSYFATEVDDVDTLIKRERFTREKAKRSSKAKRPRRTLRRLEQRKWIFDQYAHLKKRFPNLNKTELSEKIHNRFEDLIQQFEIDGRKTQTLLAINTIKKILSSPRK